MGALDTLYILVTLLTVAIIAVIGSYMLNQMYAIPYLHTANNLAVVNGWGVWDTAYIAIVVFLSIVSVILAYFAPTNPAFFIAGFLLLIITVWIAPQFSNIYAQIGNDPTLGASANNFPSIQFIMGNLPVIALVLSAAIVIIGYGKKFGGQTGIRGM